MAEDDKRKFDIPWATLLPVIAALAGIVAQYRPLVSARPGIPSEKPIEVVAAQDVDARLWQDPLAVAQKAKAQLDADLLSKHVPETRVLGHQIDSLVSRVRDSAREPGGRVLLLAVMLDSGPYIEQGESRLRARQAVLEGLNESGYVPADSEHIGFATIPGPACPIWEDTPTPTGKTAEEGFVLIPWEECKPLKEGRVYPPKTTDAFILWLPAVSFSPQPLASLAKLFEPFVEEIHDRVDVKLIGPANSTGLQQMIEEAKVWKSSPSSRETSNDALDGVWIISPLATAPASALMAASSTEDELRKTIESYVDPPEHGGLNFLRTIATDKLVLGKLIKELELRDVHVAPRKEKKSWVVRLGGTLIDLWRDHRGVPRKKEEPWVNGDHVVILTEWDTPYARSLASTFEAKASTKGKHADSQEGRPRINSFSYMHGIDGRLPGDPAKANTPADSQKTQPTQGPAAIEATEGLDQSDFLRRLARELKDEDTLWWRKGEGRIRAIGLLGSDIYDKLIILRALRPEFRDAVFFTNNFDAHFERREDWGDVRNLVVASPFGSTLPRFERGDNTFEQHVAPFRDNNQTAMFAGTLAATGRLDPVLDISREPRIFEIGRRGSVELNQENSRWFRDWLRSEGVRWHLSLAAVALLLMVVWISSSSVDRRLPGGGSSGERLKRFCSTTTFWLICGVPIIIFVIAWLAQTKGIEEPLAFFSGISIWPSEMLRLIALMLAIHFMIKASVDLGVNEREVTRCFFPGSSSPPSSPLEKWRWRNLRLGLRRWQKEYPDWGSGTPFSAREAWSAYLVRNEFWPRFIRIAMLFLIYLCFSLGVFTLFPQPVPPARGPTAFFFDFWILVPAVIAMMILTFYVVDAIRLNSNFIRIFTYGVTKWEPDIVGRERIPPLQEEDLSRYRDIFFVAQRTEVVAPLIWYPLIVLTVMFVARSSFFDNWTWPLSLILIFTLNAMWAIGSAVFLRRAAEQLREAAISNLQLLRVRIRAEEAKRETLDELIARQLEAKRVTFDELIAEIRSLKKGAFAPLTEQPFIRAIIYPSGGLGLLAVAQRLLGIF
jgi:hypothetical protein